MRRWTGLLLVALCGCSSQMRPGPIGKQLDLRLYLPDSLRQITANASDSAFHVQIPVGPDKAPVELSWTAATHTGGRYLTTLDARLVNAAPYDSLTISDLSDLQNLGSRSMPVESATLHILWFKRTWHGRQHGATSFGFDANGRRTIEAAGSR